jgi:hypothetical protein
MLAVHGMFRTPVTGGFIPDLTATTRDVENAARLMTAYKAATGKEAALGLGQAADVWGYILAAQGKFIGLLEGDDPRALAQSLANMSRTDATIGTVQGDAEYATLSRGKAYQAFVSRLAKDRLLCLAHAVGALPPENPEQGAWGREAEMPSEKIVATIERTMNMCIAPPDIDGGLWKIAAGADRYGERDLNAIYTAWLMRGMGAMNIAEIGAGSGRVAYWSLKIGALRYTTFDLPRTNVIQAFYVMKASPDVSVRLFGEPEDNQALSVLPYFELGNAPEGGFDLVLNQDSFPEIAAPIVAGYLRELRRIAPKHFLSINQESCPEYGYSGARQISVLEMIREVGGFRRAWRMPYWLRPGYVCELYDLK